MLPALAADRHLPPRCQVPMHIRETYTLLAKLALFRGGFPCVHRNEGAGCTAEPDLVAVRVAEGLPQTASAVQQRRHSPMSPSSPTGARRAQNVRVRRSCCPFASKGAVSFGSCTFLADGCSWCTAQATHDSLQRLQGRRPPIVSVLASVAIVRLSSPSFPRSTPTVAPAPGGRPGASVSGLGKQVAIWVVRRMRLRVPARCGP
jgi:hypothetical protein